MTTPTSPMSYPYPYPMPQYQDYWGNNRNNNVDNTILNSLQHQAIDKNITDTSSATTRELNNVDRSLSAQQNSGYSSINREVSAVDRHLMDGVVKINDSIYESTTHVRDNMNASALGLRDAIDRNGLNINSNLTNSFQGSADRDRDIQVSIERTSQVGTNAIERNGSALLQSVERNAGESRYSNAVLDAANRQASNDLARDIIGNVNKTGTDTIFQLSRNDNEILTAVQVTGSAGALATANSGYETRTLVNGSSAAIQTNMSSNTNGINKSIYEVGSQSAVQYSSILLEQQKSKELLSSQGSQQFASILLEQQKSKDFLSSQSSQQYASMLLEQQKVKEQLAVQLADSKYEALKNKEGLSYQMASSSAESKYESLKNTQAIQSQMAECCCEIKTRIDCVGTKVDDTLRILDTQRLRDALNTANGEVNLLKVAEFSRGRLFEPHNRGYGARDRPINNYYSPGDRSRHRSHNHSSRDSSRSPSRKDGDR